MVTSGKTPGEVDPIRKYILSAEGKKDMQDKERDKVCSKSEARVTETDQSTWRMRFA